MKIKTVKINNRKKTIQIETKKGIFDLPYSKLMLQPSPNNKIIDIFIDKDLGFEAITYTLSSGDRDSVHLDIFLDYNRDPDYLRMMFLFELTMEAKKLIKKSDISKNEICRRLGTSSSQLNRLLDQTNHKKSVDNMLRLLAILGVNVKPYFETEVA